jgi:F0F1-type ATP synthase delta subunit
MYQPAQRPTKQLVSFQQAISDSPEFHAIIQRVEDDVEKLSVWLESFCKQLRSFIEELLRTLIVRQRHSTIYTNTQDTMS